MRLFISHVTEEADVAVALQRRLRETVPGVDPFVSSTDIGAGQAWLAEVSEAVEDAAMMIVLCSPRSVDRTWVNFEAGAGFGRQVEVVPVCHGGLRAADLPLPLSIFNVVDIAARGGVEELFASVARKARLAVVEHADWPAIHADLVPAAPARTGEIGLVLAHGQDKWDDEGSGTSVFDLPRSLPTELTGPWRFRPIARGEDLYRPDLHELSGLIVGAPWQRRMSGREIDALVEWVEAGGRMLLLGFELGDRHHGGNLNDLAQRFGFFFATDIVGPPGDAVGKPYGEPVRFDPSVATAHDLTEGLGPIILTNCQTVRVEPGGKAWLIVGDNDVCVPKPSTVRYRRGGLSQPREKTVDCRAGGPVPVGAEAPAGLTGRGAVHALGTWQLLGRTGEAADGDANRLLLERLLDWLAGGSP